MTIAKVLSAFDRKTKIEFWIGDSLIDSTKTVGDFLDDKMASCILVEEPFEIKGGKIIIRTKLGED